MLDKACVGDKFEMLVTDFLQKSNQYTKNVIKVMFWHQRLSPKSHCSFNMVQYLTQTTIFNELPPMVCSKSN